MQVSARDWGAPSHRTVHADQIMATMFKKHPRRNFRRKVVDEDDENDNDHETENVPAISESVDDSSKPKEQGKLKLKSGTVASSNPLLSFDSEVSKPKGKSKIKVVSSSNSLLSFDDEITEENEVFKVKKSKESRRLAKRLDQERKKKDKIDEKKAAGDGSIDQKQDDDTDEKLAALRAELSQMAGDDDEVSDNDNVDALDSESVKKEPVSNSNVRTGASDISIPDAATIHAARKRREMARQTEQDFIPLDDTKRYEGHFASAGRLVREDENDISDDEGEEGAITFSVSRKRGFPALDRRREVEAALANQELDEKSDNEEAEDEELKLWEDEQIRKGVKGVSVPLVQQELLQTSEVSNSLYQQPYTGGQLLQEQPYLYGTGYAEIHTNGNQMYGPAAASSSLQTRHAVTVDMICDRMKQQLATLQEVHRGHEMGKEKVSSQLETAQGSIKKLERQGRNAEQRFSFFQEMRGYVRDLIECLNNKVGDTSMN